MHTTGTLSVYKHMTHTKSPNDKPRIETMPVYPITIAVGDELRFRVTKYGCSILHGKEGICRIRSFEPAKRRDWVVHIDERQEDGTFKPSLCRFFEHGIEFGYLGKTDFHAFYWRAIPETERKRLTATPKATTV